MIAQDVARSLSELDFNRSASGVARPNYFKQWVHMTVVDPSIALMVNFSSGQDGAHGIAHRLTLLVFSESVRGYVRHFPAEVCRVPRGKAEHRFDQNGCSLAADSYSLELLEPAIDARASLVLKARTHASSVQNVRLAEDATFSWTVVPRLEATGTIADGGRVHTIVDAPAYRDRNWGSLSFGDVTWDWGYTIANAADAPYTVVFTRVMSRARAEVLEQSMLVWRGAEFLAAFRDRELTFKCTGRVRAPLLTLPASLAICRPGTASDVPEEMIVKASSSRGALRLAFVSEKTARLVVPNDGRPGTSLMHETLGRCAVDGRVEGHDVRFEGRGFLECVDG